MAESFSARLAHKLASHEKEVRDEGVTLVERWLASKHELSELELLKAWKALFFCMWHSDKPLVQHDLAWRLARSQHVVQSGVAAAYRRAFWATLHREWANIDRYRIDKFMWLVRFFVHESFVHLRNSKWSDSAVTEMMEVLTTAAMSTAENAASGLRMHVSDVYLEELGKVVDDELLLSISSELLATLMQPFLAFASHHFDAHVIRQVLKPTFLDFAEKLEAELAPSGPVSALSADELDALTERRSKAAAHLKTLSAQIFALATKPEIAEMNRSALYKTRTPLEAAQQRLAAPLSSKKRKARDDDASANKKQKVSETATPGQTKEEEYTGDTSVESKKGEKAKETKQPSPKKDTEVKKPRTDKAPEKKQGEAVEKKSAAKKESGETRGPLMLKDIEVGEEDEDDEDDADFESFDESDEPLPDEDESDDGDADDNDDDDEDSADADDMDIDDDSEEQLAQPLSKGKSKDKTKIQYTLKPPRSQKTPAAQIFARHKAKHAGDNSAALDATRTPQPKATAGKQADTRQTQSAPSTPAQKRVKINLKKNQSIELESIVMKGRSPHRPDAKPAAGILRSAQKKSPAPPPGANSGVTNEKKSRPTAADYF